MKDLMNLMKQAQQMQARMGDLQAELDAMEVEGTSGGGLVVVRLSAKGDMRAVSVDPGLMKPDEKEIVEDLIVAAHAEARRKGQELVAEKMKELTGGLPMPPGLGFGM